MNDEFGASIITIMDEDSGQEYTFQIVDELDCGDEHYVALLPVYDENDDRLDMQDSSGELLVLRAEEDDGEEIFVTIEDDDEYNRVTDMFVERLQDYYEINEADDQ